MRHRYVIAIFAALSCTAMILSGVTVSEAIQYPLKMKIGCIGSPKSPWGIATIKFAELVTERTKGQVEVKAYPSSQLGSNKEMVRQLSGGVLEFTTNTHKEFSIVERNANIYGAPFLYQNPSTLHKNRCPAELNRPG